MSVNVNEPSFLVCKGNFTQRQFDALGRIWEEWCREKCTDQKTLPCLQLSGSEGDLGIMTVHKDGTVSTCSIFNSSNSNTFDSIELVKKLSDTLDEQDIADLIVYLSDKLNKLD